MTIARVRPASGLNLREKPNGKVLGVLPRNKEVQVLEEVTFYRVKTSDGQAGYVHGDFVEILPDEEQVVVSPSPPSSMPGPSASPGETTIESTFPSPQFELVHFAGENFVGEKAMVDRDFVAALSRVDRYAGDCGLKVWVTSSTRNLNQQVRGAIVPPASRSCHHVGHAIDMNLQLDGKLYNSKKLKKANLDSQPEAIGKFIDMIRLDNGLRWGGDFGREDPVHIDDNLFREQEMIYMSKLHSRVAQVNA